MRCAQRRSGGAGMRGHSKHRVRNAAILVAAAAPALMAARAQAQTFNWIAGGGLWNAAGNWSPAGPPTASSIVNILNNDATVRAVTFNFDYPTPLAIFTLNQTG